MKKINLLGVFMILFSTTLMAQFKSFSIEKSDVQNLKIVQIDNRELSTLIHFQYIENTPGFRWISTSEDFYIKDNSNFKKYKLLNSINLPFSPQMHVNEKVGQVHNFTLEFEKIPDGTVEIDIIENVENGFNFYGVKIDWNQKISDFIDVTSFIEESPVKEFGFYYKDGKQVYYYKYKGITMVVLLTYDNNYGKYYQANIIIKNNSGKDLHFYPEKISATLQKKEKKFDGYVLSYNEYMKKVRRRQSWNNFAVAFSESMAASGAGYSSSTTTSSSSSYSNSSGYASGFVGNTYGSVYGSSSTYGSTYGTSYSQSYDGAAAYAAQQNANRNTANYQNQQYKIKKTLSEGYLRLNTIPDETEYIGYINIKYKKVDHLQIDIPFFETNFTFVW
jgi:hypothetical protein